MTPGEKGVKKPYDSALDGGAKNHAPVFLRHVQQLGAGRGRAPHRFLDALTRQEIFMALEQPDVAPRHDAPPGVSTIRIS